ncbi:MAG: hypothetical protein AB1941_01655 [Gemmatimonadota bacterium]
MKNRISVRLQPAVFAGTSLFLFSACAAPVHSAGDRPALESQIDRAAATLGIEASPELAVARAALSERTADQARTMPRHPTERRMDPASPPGAADLSRALGLAPAEQARVTSQAAALEAQLRSRQQGPATQSESDVSAQAVPR